VADFRDPMAQQGYPADPKTWQAFKDIEAAMAREAAALVFVTPSARTMYRERYPEGPDDRFVMIENGYDEESFVAAERAVDESVPLNPGCFTLLHSGIVYPSERDPSALFEVLGRLRASGRVTAARLRIRFRAPVHDDLLQRLAAQSGTGDLVEILPAVPYREALTEMVRADGLLVMQGANCNEQVPAKLYEYLRARRPILGLADPVGDTARTMQSGGVSYIARLEDAQAVEAALVAYLAGTPAGVPRPPMAERLAAMSRRSRARELAALFERVSGQPAAPRA
jgi:glycosyltransferase involved in cell wall biosynthesis